jgi:hypothetical protein
MVDEAKCRDNDNKEITFSQRKNHQQQIVVVL